MFDNFRGVFVHGAAIENNLLKVAINFAENGLLTWFVTPQEIDALPDDVKVPDTEVTKLITILYMKDHVDLLSMLHGIHSWHKVPNVIIVNSLNVYVKEEHSNLSAAAYIVSSILAAADVCSKKHKDHKAIVLMGCPSIAFYQKLVHLHCFETFNADSNDIAILCKQIT